MGKSSDLSLRLRRHWKGVSSNIKLQNAINKYGWENFEWGILEFYIPTGDKTLDLENLIKLEDKYLIELFDNYPEDLI